jgi:hypothetical protein
MRMIRGIHFFQLSATLRRDGARELTADEERELREKLPAFDPDECRALGIVFRCH